MNRSQGRPTNLCDRYPDLRRALRHCSAAEAPQVVPEAIFDVAVAVSGLGQEQDRRKTLAAGFDHHLTKPVNPDQLLALLSSLESADQVKA